MTSTDPQAELLERLRRLEDREEIASLYIAYGRFLDDGDAAGYASLFARDAKLRLGGVMRADGREAIAEAAGKLVHYLSQSTRKSYHVIASPGIEIDGDRAVGECVWVAVSGEPGEAPSLSSMGRHRDELVREDGRWRFASRKGLLDLDKV